MEARRCFLVNQYFKTSNEIFEREIPELQMFVHSIENDSLISRIHLLISIFLEDQNSSFLFIESDVESITRCQWNGNILFLNSTLWTRRSFVTYWDDSQYFVLFACLKYHAIFK